MKNLSNLFRKSTIVCCFSLIAVAFAQSQTITLVSTSSSSLPGTICPKVTTQYSINPPAGCKPNWSATNGSLNTPNLQNTISVTWDDTPGATATLSVTFTGCTNSNDNSKSVTPWSVLILSVKDQSISTYSSTPINVDFCAKSTVHLQIPHVYVQGTGAIFVC